MTQDDVIEIAQEVGMDYLQFISLESMEKVIRFVNLVEIKASANERKDIIQIIKETPFSNWFQADVIEAIRVRGEQA
jgi:glutamine phosphoribosylpyrophosphate amidotransferase